MKHYYRIVSVVFFVFVTYISQAQETLPGGLSDGLELWLKADWGTISPNPSTDNHIIQWEDQSGNGHHANAVDSDPEKKYSAFNFNKAIGFDGDDALSGTWNYSKSKMTFFIVGNIVPDEENRPDRQGWQRLFSATKSDENDASESSFVIESNGDNKKVKGYSGSGIDFDGEIDGFPHVYTFQTDDSNDLWQTASDGSGFESITRSGAFDINGFAIGKRAFKTSGYLEGEVSEIIAFSSELSSIERMKVESYLALKYGITLDNKNGDVHGDYLAADGTILWDASANAAYHHDVIGLVRDNASGLYQKQSKQSSDEIGLAVYLGSQEGTFPNSNLVNSSVLNNNLQSLLIGHDGNTGSSNNRLNRVYKVEDEGGVPRVTLSFDNVSNLENRNDSYYLLTSPTADFNQRVEVEYIELTDYDNGKFYATVDFEDNSATYFTIANSNDITNSLGYDVTVASEYEITHKITLSEEIFEMLENESAYLTLSDATEGEIYNQQVDLQDQSTGYSGLWEQSLDLDYGYAALPGEYYTSTSDSWTVEVYVKLPYTQYNTLDLFSSEPQDGMSLSYSFSTKWVINSQGKTAVLDNMQIDKNAWTHVAMTYGNGQLKLYVDGGLINLPSDFDHTSGSNKIKFIGSTQMLFMGELGLVRCWNTTRTQTQLKVDMNNVYRGVSDHIYPSGLYDEWTFDRGQTNYCADDDKCVKGINSKTLYYQFAPIRPNTFDAKSLNYTHYVAPGTTHNYTLKVSEVGSGRVLTLITENMTSGPSRATTFSESASVFDNTVNTYQNSFAFTTTSRAEEFIISRKDNHTNEEIEVETIDTPYAERNTDGSGAYVYSWSDSYDESSETTILGGHDYTYSVVPVYKKINAKQVAQETDYKDKDAVATIDIATHDLNLSAGYDMVTDALDLSWDETMVKSTFGDTVLLTRDGNRLARLVGVSTYQDITMTYGKAHTYGIHPIVNGEVVYGQYIELDENSMAPANGIVQGWLLDNKNDFVIENQTYTATSTIEEEEQQVTLFSDQEYGKFKTSSVYYGEEATYVLDELPENEFILNRSDHELTLLVKTDSVAPESDEKGIFVWNGLITQKENVTEFTWLPTVVSGFSSDYSLNTSTTIYTNVYRDRDLIGIVAQTGTNTERLTFMDTTGVAGQQYAYSLKSYGYDTENKIFLHHDTSFVQLYPEMSVVTGLSVAPSEASAIGSDDVLVLTFSYPALAYADYLEVFRTRSSTESYDSVSIGHVPYTQSGSYTFTDRTGVPGQTYEYQVVAVSGSDISEVSESVWENYPLINDQVSGKILENKSDSDVGRGDWVSLPTTTDLSATDNYSGFVLFADSVLVASLDKSQAHYDESNSKFYYNFKNYLGTYQQKITYEWARYKINEEGTFVLDRSDVDQSNYEGFGTQGSNTLPDLNLSASAGIDYHKLTWTNISNTVSQTAWQEGIQVDHWMISDRKKDVTHAIEVDPNIGSLTGNEFAGQDQLYMHQMSADNEIIKTTRFELEGEASTSTESPGMWEITNFEASDDLSDGIFLSWEYRDFSAAQFEIYRDGVLIKTTSSEARWYHDQDAMIASNMNYAYQVRAVYDADNNGSHENFSKRATDAGMRKIVFIAEGYIYDSEGTGVPGIAMNIGRKWTETDSTGHYRFDEIYGDPGTSSSHTLTLNEYNWDSNEDEMQSYTITLKENQLVYTKDFTLNNFVYQGMAKQHATAAAFAITAHPNPYDYGVELRIQLTSGKYDGVKLSRYLHDIADLTNHEDLVYFDQSGESGHEQVYTATPYILDANSEKIYGTAQSVNADFPVLSPPAYLETEEVNGYTVLKWADEYPGRGYRIVINNQVVADLGEDEDNSYTHTNGVTGQNYRYQIYSFIQSEGAGSAVLSEGFTAISKSYPYSADVEDLTTSENKLTNAIEVSWSYPDLQNTGITAMELLRNGEVIYGPTDDLGMESYSDTTGIPGTISTYEVRTYRDIVETSSLGNKKSVLFPDLPDIQNLHRNSDQNKLIETISWDYEVRDFDGFNVTVEYEHYDGSSTNQSNKTHSAWIAAVANQTQYQYIHHTSVPDTEYTITIVPSATRGGETYQAAAIGETYIFPALPAFQPTLNWKANGDYALISWDYADLPVKEWKVSVSSSDKFEQFKRDIVQNLANTERQYLFTYDNYEQVSWHLNKETECCLHNGDNKISFTIQAKGYTEAGSSATVDWEPTINSLNYPIVTASRDIANRIDITMSLRHEGESGKHLILYRDGVKIHTVSNVSIDAEYQYQDLDISPGNQYVYEVQHVFDNTTSWYSAAMGMGTGMTGNINGSLLTKEGNGVGGVEMRLTGLMEGYWVIDTVITHSNGQYAFGNLPFGKNDQTHVEYTVTPVPDNIDYAPGQVTAQLSSGLTTMGLEPIFDQSSILISGVLQYSATDLLVSSDSYTASIFGSKYDENGETFITSTKVEGGQYTFDVPYNAEMESYRIKLTTSAGEGTAVNTEPYYYFKSLENVIAASTIQAGDEVMSNFTDTLLVPIVIQMMESDCKPITDYTWSMFLSEDEGYDTLIYMTGSQALDLPAKNYNVKVLDVTPLTSKSKSFLEELRSKTLYIPLGDSLLSYKNKYDAANDGTVAEHQKNIPWADGSLFPKVYEFNYVGPVVIIPSFTPSQTHCLFVENPEPDQVSDAYILTSGQEYTIKMDLHTVMTDGSNCELSSGYVVVNNGGGTTTDGQSDTLRYDGAWEAYTFTASNINPITPFTRGIEFNYYDQNDNYLRTEIMTVVVTGAKSLAGSGFILDPDQTLYPLFVLHDPPGDGSSAWIDKGSSMNYQISNGFEASEEVKIAKEFSIGLFSSGIKNNISLTTDFTEKKSNSGEFTLSFNERIETSGQANYHFEAEKYNIDKAADVIVGLGVVNKYGAARTVAVDGDCKVTGQIQLTVQPHEISTQWVMTRLQLEEDLAYYQRLAGKDKNVKTAEIESGKVADNSKEKPFTKKSLEDRINDIQHILDWHDTKYRIPVKVCEMVEHIHERLYSKILEDDFNGRLEDFGIRENFYDLSRYCRSTDFLKKTKKKTIRSNANRDGAGYFESNIYEYEMAGVTNDNGDFTPSWTNSDIEEFDEVMNQFQDLWTSFELFQAEKSGKTPDTEEGNYIDTRDDNLSKKRFDYVENISFSAGLHYAKSLTSSESFSHNAAFGLSVNILDQISTFVLKTVTIGTWAGLGAGAQILTNTAEVKGSASLDLGFGIGYNISQVKTNGSSLSIGYHLIDDDPGDEFNVWVMTDPTGHNYYSSPEFYVTSGHSSCPWEEGTIKRDDFKIAITDEDGNPSPSTLVVEGDELLVFKLKIWNESPLEEYKQGGITGGPNTGMDGETLKANGDFPIHPIFPSSIYTQGSEPLYFTTTLSKIFAPAVKGTVVFRPYVGGACNVTDLAPSQTDHVDITMVFISPVSPVSLPLDRGNWLISTKKNALGQQTNRSLSIELNDLEVGNDLFQLDQVIVEARALSDAQNDWRLLTDIAGETIITLEDLNGGYSVFQWEPSTEDFPDGEYEIKAIVYGESGGSSESEAWTGRVDLTTPYLAKWPEPADELLSKGDGVGLTMSETINAGKFTAQKESVITIDIHDNENGSVVESLDYYTGTDSFDQNAMYYTASVNGSGLDIMISNAVLSTYDGHSVTITVSGLEDMAGNPADDIQWSFKLDAFNYPVSAISLYVNNDRVDENGRYWLNSKDDVSEQKYYASDYDAFEKTSRLDEVKLRYRFEEGDWIAVQTLTRSDLQSGTDNVAIDMSSDAYQEGKYEFQFVAWAAGQNRASESIYLTIDQTAPVVVSSPVRLEKTDQFEVTFSEEVEHAGNFEVTAKIGDENFEAISAYLGDQGVSFVLDKTHEDYEALYTSFGSNLEITIEGVFDLASNELEDNVLSIPLGNFSENVSDINISHPDLWVMNIEHQATSFVVDGYDLYSQTQSLDSVDVVYKESRSNDFMLIKRFYQSDLASLYESRTEENSNEPEVEVAWDLSNLTIEDGQYYVYAIAYGDHGKTNYSESAAGAIDRTAPEFMDVFEPADGMFNVEDQYFEFTFSEPIGDFDGVTISQMVNGNATDIPSGTYRMYSHEHLLRIVPNETFLSTYSAGLMEVHLDEVVDLHGNVMIDDQYLQFTMDDFSDLNSGARRPTDLVGSSVETGAIELSWTSFQDFDRTILERSRTGRDFVEVASYLGDVSRHQDKVNFNKVIFYRLKQMQDTSAVYSKVVGIENENRIPVLMSHAYPNPSDGDEFEISILTSNDVDNIDIEIYNVSGILVYSQAFASDAVMHSNLVIRPRERFDTGVYQVVISQGSKRSEQKMIVLNVGH
ncbi:MAG: LamG-like jellyroll fold domain-containing protein [Reichenbachiella sp.]|uniref:LamG-like jellyroll fold domain-containing protein n=1 Tax=Reichenbachiella sp. TaxID=2184521 RepID=UPI003266A201